jgi:uncharacterized protein (TIGR03083 family)
VTNDEIIARVEQSWTALNAALDGIPPDRLAEPGVCGDWSVKDLLGHVAFWDRHAVETFRRRAAGEEPEGIDWRAANDRDAAAKANRDFASQQTEFDDAHAEIVDTLRSTPNLDPDQIKVDTWDHYDEHAAEIRAWRQREGI